MATDLQLQPFNLNRIKAGNVVCVMGRRGSGKTTLLKDILYHKRKIPTGTLFGGRYDLGEHFPSTFVLDTYDPVVVSQIVARSKRLQTVPTTVVFDDCMYDKNAFRRDKCFREILMNGRHYSILLLLSMQYCMDLDPSMRSQFDYVFAFKDNVLQNVERLWRSFFGIVDSLENFRAIMRSCTENYNCIVLDNTSLSNRLEDVLFYYHADIHPPFVVGGKRYWRFHQMHGRSDDDEGSKKIVKLQKRLK